MKTIKACLVSLGCEKNLVDSEMILGLFKKAEATITTDPWEANVIIVNTCGFITAAKQEALDEIMAMSAIKEKTGAKLVVCGCLAERYAKDLADLLPEADAIIPLHDYLHFGDILKQLLAYEGFNTLCPTLSDRLIATPSYQAYVKLGDGCNNRCAYCAIPLIRGRLQSESQESVLAQVTRFLAEGRKEIILVSQDTSAYGRDRKTTLLSLLEAILGLPGVVSGAVWFRLLYLYPDELTEDLLRFLAAHADVFLPYYDIPLQHASEKILHWMRRKGSAEKYLTLLRHIRELSPEAVLRTTMIVGFPHETDADFETLLSFVKDAELDHLGAFTFSREEGTPAYTMTHQVSEAVKKDRLARLMSAQRKVSFARNTRRIGWVGTCLIESREEEGLYAGRTYAFAPDDIDGAVFVSSSSPLDIGSFVKIRITDVDDYDVKACLA